MSLPLNPVPWRGAIDHALDRHRDLAHARYLQMATVRANGHPANRTVVFRGFLENSLSLKFITDIRSEKAEQLQLHPWAEVCWYFPQTREQFRLAGDVLLIADGHDTNFQTERILTWQGLSDGARSQFAWSFPGRKRVKDAEEFPLCHPDPLNPKSNFCLLLLNPVEVDHLELRGEPQNRRLYLCDKNHVWSTQEINP